jgi:hypothetical protein
MEQLKEGFSFTMGKPEFKQCLLIVTFNNKNSNGIFYLLYM